MCCVLASPPTRRYSHNGNPSNGKFGISSQGATEGWQTKGIGFPGEHPISVSPDPVKDTLEKRLLLGRIKADTTKELPTPLLNSLIDNNITSNHIPAVKSPSGDLDSS